MLCGILPDQFCQFAIRTLKALKKIFVSAQKSCDLASGSSASYGLHGHGRSEHLERKLCCPEQPCYSLKGWWCYCIEDQACLVGASKCRHAPTD